MTWRLKLPPSANRIVRPTAFTRTDGEESLRLVKTSVAKKWLSYAHDTLAMYGLRPLPGPLDFSLEVHVHSIASDLNNRLKQLEDAFKGRVWFDDCQVIDLHNRKFITTEPEEFVLFSVRTSINVQPELAERMARSNLVNGRPPKPKKKKAAPNPYGATPSLFR